MCLYRTISLKTVLWVIFLTHTFNVYLSRSPFLSSLIFFSYSVSILMMTVGMRTIHCLFVAVFCLSSVYWSARSRISLLCSLTTSLTGLGYRLRWQTVRQHHCTWTMEAESSWQSQEHLHWRHQHRFWSQNQRSWRIHIVGARSDWSSSRWSSWITGKAH